MPNPSLRHADPQRVLSALMALHRAWPLERRIRREACDATRETYVAVLLRWIQVGVAPTMQGFDPETLEELTALDALLPVEDRLGCPPFSAAATDIRVHFPHETVFALSALDALALPRLVGAAATIEASCAMSGRPVRLRVTEEGVPAGDGPAGIVVALRKVADRVDRYAFDLAPGIRFVDAEAASGLRQSLDLAEACAVANAFYAYQRTLIRGDDP